MSTESAGTWVGASGHNYVYHSYPLETSIPARMGNYIYAKKNHEGLWVPLHMGQGDLSVCCADAQILDCIRARAATHLHLRLNRSEEERQFELRDLLDRYLNAFHPDGCQGEADRRPIQDRG